MIAVNFHAGQGMGNQLWVYVAARSIAEQLGMPHHVFNPEQFKGAAFLEIDPGVSISERTGLPRITAQDFAPFTEQLFFDAELDYFASDFDARVRELRPNTLLDGLFQSEEYFFGDLTRLGRYLRLKPEYAAKQLVPEDCCVIYIRGGEYKRYKNLILPESYWRSAMGNMQERFGINRFIAVSDDDRYVKALLPELPFVPGGMAEDYVALSQARFAIVANSSWGYFPAKTGILGKQVIAPMHWSRFNNPFSRWASPANFYQDWLWQDASGQLRSHQECLEVRNATSAFYRENYQVLTAMSSVQKRHFRQFFPSSLRRTVKRLLSGLFPRSIG